MTTKVKNMAQLRDEVLSTLADVKNDPRRAIQAHEVGNLAGKVVNMCKVHLERCALNEEKSAGEWDRFITEV
jgi:hypothetical protein